MRRGGFTVVWALVTARGGHGVLGIQIVVLNKNMLVSLQKRKKEKNTCGPNDGKPSFGPSYVDGGGRRLSSSWLAYCITL